METRRGLPVFPVPGEASLLAVSLMACAGAYKKAGACDVLPPVVPDYVSDPFLYVSKHPARQARK